MQPNVVPITQTRGFQNPASARFVANHLKVYNQVRESSGGILDREEGWIQQIGKGDLQAFEQLCKSYQRRLFSYLYRFLHERESTEEVLSDVLFGIWKSAANFHGQAKPSTWIFAIARNKALRYLGRKQQPTVVSEELDTAADERHGPEMDLVHKDLIRWALKSLSPEHREVIELTFYSGFSYQEIALIADCPVNTVKTRMFHAKKRLKHLLAESQMGERHHHGSP